MIARMCCPLCFGDKKLPHNIVAELEQGNGVCGFCATAAQPLITPIHLRDYFDLIISPYIRDDSGQSLVNLLQSDWELFVGGKMQPAIAKELLSEILDDGEIVRKKFAPETIDYSSDSQWDNLRTELLHENRYFPNSTFDHQRLGNFLPYLLTEEQDLVGSFYRARIENGDGAIGLEKMSAPPKELASHGRANPAGIPYLYLASDATTAASEVRAHAGERCSIAEFQLTSNLTVINLQHPRKTISPFRIEDEDQLRSIRAGVGLLERVGQELTIPISAHTSAYNYVPTQYLCEFIKSQGYDGVFYRSSTSKGVNLALFDPNKAEGLSVKSCSIKSLEITLTS